MIRPTGMADPARFVRLVFPLALPGSLSYRVPPEWAESLRVGQPVLAPVGSARRTGWVWRLEDTPPAGVARVRPIERVLDPQPAWPEEMTPLLDWMANYYHHPIGEVVQTALPRGLGEIHRAHWKLTEAGRAALSDVQAQPWRRKVLERLADRSQLESALRQGLGKGREGGDRLALLIAGGWIVREEHRARGGLAIRTEPWVRRLPAGSAPPTPTEGRVLEALGEPMPVRALGAVHPRAAQHVAALEAKGWVARYPREVYRDPFPTEPPARDDPRTLNDEQQAALAALTDAFGQGGFQPFLLQGITGSGKTEVYLQFIAHVLAAGRTALVLVPEISLTPQLVGRFRARFGEGIAVLHSGLSAGERYDQWRRIRRGEASVAVGVRSAVFAPLERLGAILVDEEHDASFKQDEGLPYNARDVALMRAKLAGLTAVLGSATPRLESLWRARSGEYRQLRLTRRATGAPLPAIRTVRITEAMEAREFFAGGMLTPALIDAVRETVGRGEQALLYLNRRGYHPQVACGRCGTVIECPNCAVTLTFHQRLGRMACHLCGHWAPQPKTCHRCGAGDLGFLGTGTERLEESIAQRLAPVRVLRLDRDAAGRKGEIERILDRFRRREADVLVGTQMITKGHDFPQVTLVGVLLAEASLNFPDFRAAEKTFATLVQVSGRAGRAAEPGRVIVQSMLPDHYAVACAVRNDLEGFVERELENRRLLGYPPFRRLALLRVVGEEESAVRREAETLAERLRRRAASLADPRPEVLGPAVCAIARIKNRRRMQVLVKSSSAGALHALLETVEGSPPRRGGGLSVTLDVDPLNML